jgi:hypothetical protein
MRKPMSNFLGLEEERSTSTATGEYDRVQPVLDPDVAVRIKRGANWFYWIAGLSVVNSIAFIVGAKFHFLAGLGVTEIADAVIEASIQQGAPGYLRAVSIIFDLIAVAGFALTGYFANKFFRTAFLVGIIFYVIDGLLVLILTDFFMLAFHAFALYSLIRGYIACREMKAHLKTQKDMIQPPPPPHATV